MSLQQAKHECGTTLGNHPELYPYVLNHIAEAPIQSELRAAIVKEERAIMMGAPDEAQLLGWLVGLTSAKKVIEVGVFRGSSTLAMALAMPADGKVVGLDVSEDFAQLGIAAWKKAGVSDKIQFVVGDAQKSMQSLIDNGEEGTFDLIFIDADKPSYPVYYELGLKLLRKNGVIVVDNVLWDGLVVKPIAEDDDRTRTIVELNEHIKNDTRVHAVMLPIADGAYLVRKL